MRACRAGWAAGLSAHSRQLQAVAASVLRGTGRRGGWTAASGLSAELQGHGAVQWAHSRVTGRTSPNLTSS